MILIHENEGIKKELIKMDLLATNHQMEDISPEIMDTNINQAQMAGINQDQMVDIEI